MTTRAVCDASAVVAMLLDAGPDGRWATGAMVGAELFAPTLLPYECSNVIRRHELSGAVSVDQAAQAHADLRDLAEALTAPLLTLDRRIKRAPGLECVVLEPTS